MPKRPQVPGTPPPSLPEGLRDLWTALRAEAERTGRGELARRLGVSTHTLQRLLVDGDLPDFRVASVRQVRSWSRTLARLAVRLGRSPRPWIEAAGIPWDAGTRDAVDTTARDTAGPRGRRDRRAADVVFVAPCRLAPDSPGEPVLLPLVRQLLHALDPDLEISPRAAPPSRALEAMDHRGGAPAVAAGLLACARLRRRGRTVLEVPGWSADLGALHVGGRGAARAAPRWIELGRDATGRAPFLVPRGDAVESWVRAHWGVPASDVAALEGATIAQLAAEIATHAAPAAIVIADRATCEALRVALPPPLHAAPIEPPDGEAPTFPLAVALPARLDEDRAATIAWQEEVFGHARTATARRYAEILRALPRPAGVDAPRAPVRLRPFALADDVFRRALSRELLAGLLAEQSLDAGSVHRDPPGAAGIWDRAVQTAHALVPAGWHAAMDAMAWAAGLELFTGKAAAMRPLLSHCLSCSMPLRESAGMSSRYCRYCSDAAGHLRPRDEVRDILARWMEGWQEGLDHATALERAARYMSALPAWSGG